MTSLKLRSKLLLIFLFLTLFPLTILSLIISYRIDMQFKEISSRRINETLEGINKEYLILVNELSEKTGLIINRRDLRRLILLTKDRRGRINQQGLIELTVNLKKSLGLNLLEVGDRKGIVLARGHERARFGSDKSNDPIISRLLEGQTWSGVAEESMRGKSFLAIKVARPLFLERSVKGTVVAGYLFNLKFLERLKGMSGAEIMIFHKDRLVLSTLELPPEEPLFSQGELAVLKNQHIIKARLGETEYSLGGFPLSLKTPEKPLSPIEQAGGLIVVGLSTQEVTILVRNFIRLITGVTAVSLLFTIFFAIFLSRQITKPISQLVIGARRIAGGDLESTITVRTGGEIGQLVETFNQMTLDLKENKAQLLKAERIAAWQEVARQIAHEIKNPLFPIQLSIQSLQRSYQRSDENLDAIFAESTDTILEEVSNLKKIVDEFSEFARLPKPIFTKANVSDIIKNTLSLYGGLPDSIVVKTRLTATLPEVSCDKDQLKRVFINIIGNALDAIGGEGEIRVNTLYQDNQQTNISEVRVEIIDNGAGIIPANLDKIFTPYFTTKQRGTGLGLAIVKRIIDDHGGRILVRSTANKGTAFTIILPTRQRTEGEDR